MTARSGARTQIGTVVLITGAAHGIGAETARQLIAAGASVALVDRDEAALQWLCEELGERSAAFVADVTDAESIHAAAHAAAEHFGGIDTVVANAGISGPVATTATVGRAEFAQTLQVNLLGVFHTVQAALPHVGARRGYVLLISSIMALIPGPATAGYAASKAGVEALGRALRVELAGAGVDVGVAYFGLIDTGMVDGIISNTGFGAVLEKLPRFFAEPAPVTRAAEALTAGIARRSRRVYAPRYVRLLLDLRGLLMLADPLLSRHRGLAAVIEEAGVDTADSGRC